MVKSPCKDCEKHKLLFPKCLDNCEILSQMQVYNILQPTNVCSSYNYEDDMMFPVSIQTSGRRDYS